MGFVTEIGWCHHTHNWWWGCVKVSRACDLCYAEGVAKRYGHDVWGPHATYRTMSASYWAEPLKWDRLAAKAGERRRVFAGSMMDWADNRGPLSELVRGLDLVRRTPNLDWLLLTKRPQNIRKRLEAAAAEAVRLGMALLALWLRSWLDGTPPANVWLGTTAEDQAEADRRLPHLLAMPAVVHFASVEPLLSWLDLSPYLGPDGLDWVIVGGESGAKARPMHPAWAIALRDQVLSAGKAFFFKQWGEWGLEPAVGEDGALKVQAAHAVALDGTLYAMADLAYSDGPRRGEAIRAGHEAGLHTVYRRGKGAAGRVLDGCIWTQFPMPTPANALEVVHG